MELSSYHVHTCEINTAVYISSMQVGHGGGAMEDSALQSASEGMKPWRSNAVGRKGAMHKCLLPTCLSLSLCELGIKLGHPSVSPAPLHHHLNSPLPSPCLLHAAPPAPHPPPPPASLRNHIQGLTRAAVVVPPPNPPSPQCLAHHPAERTHSS